MATAYYDRDFTLAQRVLDLIVAEYRACEIKPPDVRFIADGLIVYDCELLAVGINRVYPIAGESSGPAGEGVRPDQGWAWRGGQFEVVTLRRSPQVPEHEYDTVTGPPPSQVTDSAKAVHRDRAIAMYALQRAAIDETLGVGANVAIEGWSAVGEEGGLVGGRFTFRIGL